LVARTSDDAAALTPEVRRMVGSVDARIALWSPRTLEDAHAWLTRIPRAMSWIAVGGGSAGLLVAAVGLYGLLAFRVRQRRRELGVRLALGANGRRLARETLVVAARQLVPAVAIGLSVAWLVSPILGAFLLGAEPRAPSTYVGVGATFVAVGLVAALLPALRAAATDPAEVLRGG
jgi:ABC-type antimicrobial peptide transport system permease subunit